MKNSDLQYKFEKIVSESFCSIHEIKSFIEFISKPLKNSHNFYMNYEAFPSEEYTVENFPMIQEHKRTGILIQGPIVFENHFTYNSIKIYRKLFNNPLIVLSTWIDQDTNMFKDLEQDGLIIIKNHYPDQKGFLNLNYMITSTIEGLRELKKHSIEYVVRTRTDQRIMYENVEDFFYQLLKMFTKVDDSGQKERIITMDKYTSMFVPFHISDMFQFGNIDDLIDYWSVSFSSKYLRKGMYEKLSSHIKIIEEQEYDRSEIFLGINYAKLILKSKYSYEYRTYLDFLAQCFIIIDSCMIGLVWHKFRSNERSLCCESHQLKLLQNITFKDWLLLKQGSVDINEFNESNKRKLDCKRFGYDAAIKQV